MGMTRATALRVAAALLALPALPGCGDAGGSGGGFECPDGVNPDGNGCLLPCADGWHEAANGLCVVDCPTPASEGDGGLCDVTACPDGWNLVEREFADGSHSFCQLGCPDGMELAYMGGAFWGCVYPCPDGWAEGADGLCHLGCPDGMVAVDGPAGCEMASVGEDAECPTGPWDTSFAGANPVYVDQALGSADGDGTTTSPFATIGQAIAAASALDSLTIYVAAGDYAEHVWLQDKVEANLIGACAEEVRIAPATLPSPDGYLAGAVHATNVDNVAIRGVTIDSPGYGVRVEHDGSAGQPESVRVEQVVVEQAVARGIAVWAPFDEARVRRCTVRQALGGIGFVDISVQSPPVGNVSVEENLVEDLDPLGDNPFDFIYGVAVEGSASATVSGNTIRGFTEAVAISAQGVSAASVTGNLVTGLEGLAGVYLRVLSDIPEPIAATVEGNVFSDCAAGPNGVDPPGEKFSGVAFVQEDGELLCRGNRFTGVQGPGVWSSSSPEAAVTIEGCEFSDGPLGVLAYGGSLAIADSRFQDLRVAIVARDEGLDDAQMGPVSIGGSSFTRRSDGGHDLPVAGPLDEILDLGADVELSMIEAPLEIASSAFFESLGSAEDTGQHHSVSVGRCGSLAVSGSSFSSNDGVDVWSLDTPSTFAGNRFVDGEIALYLASEGAVESVSSSVDGNFFGATMALLAASLVDQDFSLELRGNGAVTAGMFLGFDQATWEMTSLVAESNSFLESFISWRSFRQATFADNLLRASSLIVARAEASSTTSIEGNALVRSGIYLDEILGPAEVVGNGVFFGLRRGTGIGVFGSSGPVSIRHNIVADVEAAPLAGIGEIGDGIHVVGDPDAQASAVEITANLVRGSSRLGILLHGSQGTVEGNMYAGNGCGLECDLVVQSPAGEGVAGWDTGFASYPESAYAVIPAQEALDW